MKDTAVLNLLPTALTVSTTQESTRMNKLGTLPVLASFMTLSLRHAVLTFGDGFSIDVDAQQPGVWATVSPEGYLVVGEEGIDVAPV